MLFPQVGHGLDSDDGQLLRPLGKMLSFRPMGSSPEKERRREEIGWLGVREESPLPHLFPPLSKESGISISPPAQGSIPSQAEEGPSAKWSTFTLLKWPIYKNSLHLPQA